MRAAALRVAAGSVVREGSPMRITAGRVAEGLAWAVIAGLVGVALTVADLLGFLGLLLLGLATLLVCTRAELDGDVPTWGAEVFRAGMSRPASPERRAAAREDRRSLLPSLRFFRRCGAVLALAGALGLAWQLRG